MQPSLETISLARTRITPHVVYTPLVRATELSAWLKLETQQPTGSFKVRPAFNSLLANLEQARASGVVASSSGNFAQAVAYAARALGVDAKIVMPSNTSPYKIERTRCFGAGGSAPVEVVLSGPSFEERWALTTQLQAQSGRLLVHPYDSVETISGDGTLGLELLEQLSGDFTVAVPTSGGGLLAGVALTLKRLRPGCRVVGVQSAANGAMPRSFAEGKRVQSAPFTSIADALVATLPGERAFELILSHVDEVVAVSEQELREAVVYCATEQKLVVEPGGAAAVAALRAGKLGRFGGQTVCVLSGGNILPAQLAEFIHPA